jgi:hypothetical protein
LSFLPYDGPEIITDMDIIEADRVKKEQKRDELSKMVPKLSE